MKVAGIDAELVLERGLRERMHRWLRRPGALQHQQLVPQGQHFELEAAREQVGVYSVSLGLNGNAAEKIVGLHSIFASSVPSVQRDLAEQPGTEAREMRKRFLGLIGVAAVIVAVTVLLKLAPASLMGQAAKAEPAPRTAWGDPDLQGIWTDDYQTPLERPRQFANKEFFTEAEIAALDKQRAAILRQDHREPKGSERDVSGAYNAVFVSVKHTGRRTSLVVEPPDGRIPPLTPEAQKRLATFREYRLALLQATETCKTQEPACAGWKYARPSPRRAERAPQYNTERLNRTDGPEDRSLLERCMGAILPDTSGFRRIVQSPGSVAIFYDVGQGQGWQRVIPVNNSPHLPSQVRQWWGDSRGRWEGNTLVVDVTNFSPKQDFRGSRENLHLVERWTRSDANTLEYQVTIDDAAVWTRPWTVKHEMRRQSDRANRIYYEPRCHEGNYGMVGMLASTRAEELAFAVGRGPDPATRDSATGGPGGGEENSDPLGGGGQ